MEAAGLTPDPWQEKLLRGNARRVLLLCTRQAGKSTVTAALALHESMTRPNTLTLLLAPALRQAGELFRKVMTFYDAIERPVPAVAETALGLELRNGSRIVSLPGKEATVRGYSAADLLIVDEAARVPDELYFSIRPMLAVSGGKLLAMTTPFGKRGFFHHEWEEGTEEWERVEIDAYQCPRISHEFLEEERRTLGDWWFEQEYLCRFKDTVDSVFRYEDVMAAMSDEVQPLFAVPDPVPGGALSGDIEPLFGART